MGELFPTPVRQMATAFSVGTGLSVGLLAPFIGGPLVRNLCCLPKLLSHWLHIYTLIYYQLTKSVTVVIHLCVSVYHAKVPIMTSIHVYHLIFQGHVWLPLPYIIYGVFALLACAASSLLPETLGKVLPETIEEAEEMERCVQI